jgi:hypothetical protein
MTWRGQASHGPGISNPGTTEPGISDSGYPPLVPVLVAVILSIIVIR